MPEYRRDVDRAFRGAPGRRRAGGDQRPPGARGNRLHQPPFRREASDRRPRNCGRVCRAPTASATSPSSSSSRARVRQGRGPAMTALPPGAYEECPGRGSDEPLPWPAAERADDPISINYTSGTTGDPKGVSYTHRGAYLNALGDIIHSGHSGGIGVPLDAAHVPLQRVVHHLGRDRGRWNARLLASCQARRDLATDRCGRCDPPQRRPGRDDVDRARAPGASIRARGHSHDGGRRAQPDLRRRDGSAGSAGDPRVRAYRGLWAVLDVRLAAGLACARRSSASAKARHGKASAWSPRSGSAWSITT